MTRSETALVPVKLMKFDGEKILVKLPGSEWEPITEANANRLLGTIMTTHFSWDNGETWPKKFY